MLGRGDSIEVTGERGNATVRLLYKEFTDTLQRVHDDIELRHSRFELRAVYRGELICRLVLYPELLRVEIAGDPSWEARVRTETAFLAVIDRAIERFLHIYKSSPRDTRAIAPPLPDE